MKLIKTILVVHKSYIQLQEDIIFAVLGEKANLSW